MHNEGYMHRDVKLENILVKTEGNQNQFLLSDFGTAKKIESMCKIYIY